MTDFPISHLPSVNSTGRIAAGFAQLIILFRSVLAARAQATAPNAERGTSRRTPEEILATQARREEARRAADRLMQHR
jgi:hypothetical protein